MNLSRDTDLSINSKGKDKVHLYSTTTATLAALCITDTASVQPRPQSKPAVTNLDLKDTTVHGNSLPF